ncbi:D-galactoside/L-rhamnose binding SUEL lectin domain - like 10 [Theobroma cacao]|nr:D-galactoside/L-rhamnose binding SUEL lectin domain - like 10 [Theobroma cacao]
MDAVTHAITMAHTGITDVGQTVAILPKDGGNTTDISFQIVTVGAICGFAYECSTLELSCQGGRTIADIQFASFGDPQGSCGSYKAGSFQATTSLAAVEKAFVGKPSCSIDVSEATFGLRNLGVTKKLAVEAVCG